MEIIKYPEKKDWNKYAERSTMDVPKLFDTVGDVLADVKKRGDEALKFYEKKFDRVDLNSLEVSQAEIERAEKSLPEDLKDAILHAKRNIERFHRSEIFKGEKIETEKGVCCWQKAVPIAKVGLYVPGGTAPLFSTVLMLCIPAKIAGCREIVLCSPPDEKGEIHPAILFAAKAAGAGKIFKIGGIQAIAAMAYGTECVPKVYKIFGPGNQYVTAAKQLVSLGGVAIDMPAGPSEVEVIADERADPAFIASDFLSQAEHGVDSQSLLLTTSLETAKKALVEIEKQKASLPRREIVEKSLSHSKIIILENDDEIIEFTNLYAPEHLIVNTKNYAEIAERVENAGSVFLGPYSPESAGDYASGTNHTLPTNGNAKAYGGLNLDSFIKKMTFQEISPDGIENLGKTIRLMAENEKLDAHKNAVTIRLNSL